MKSSRIIQLSVAAVIVVAAGVTVFEGGFGHGEKTITILHTNDTHSQIFPIADDKGKWAGYGGYAKRAYLINEIRDKDHGVLLFDSGDFSQGTPYFNFFKGNIEVDAMGQMGYNAATLGNHEFDNGVAELAHRADRAKFPLLSANYGFDGSPMEGKTLPFKIFDVKGVKVGVFGLTVNVQGMVEADHTKGAVYKDPIVSAQWAADTLRSLGVDVVVALSHLGEHTTPYYVGDDSLAAKTSGIDLILGGHSHTDGINTVPNKIGENVTIIQEASQGRLLGRIDITVKKR